MLVQIDHQNIPLAEMQINKVVKIIKKARLFSVQKYTLASTDKINNEIYKSCFNLMTPVRQQKILRLKNTEQQKLSVLGEWLAKTLISEVYGISIGELVFETDVKGKPYCVNTPDIYFNISHSSDIAVAVVSDTPTGIDIEKIRPVSLKLARRACTDNELLYVFGRKPDTSDYSVEFPHPVYERFFEIWTAKEAYFKCIGTGITDLKSIDTLTDSFKKKIIKRDGFIIHIVTI